MAAVVDDYSGLMTHELKAQVQALAADIGVARARELQAGQTPKPGAEIRYLKLYEAMDKRGLGAACVPAPKPVALPMRRRLQQQQPGLHISVGGQGLPIPSSYPNMVPSMNGNH